MKIIKGVSFPVGLVYSKTSKLISSKDYYFVSDYWTATRYPKDLKGLTSALFHFHYNKRIDNMRRSEHGLREKKAVCC